MKRNIFIEKYMTYESTSDSKYNFYWANQHNQDYDKGFNMLEKSDKREKCSSTGHKWYFFFPKTSFRNIFTSINIPRVTFKKHADTHVSLLAKFVLPLSSFNPGKESTNISKTPKIELPENQFTGL